MIGGVTRYMLPRLSGVPHLHVNNPLVLLLWCSYSEELTTLLFLTLCTLFV